MTRRSNTKRQQRTAAALGELPAGPLRAVDVSATEWVPKGLISAYANNRFSVQLTEDASRLRLSVRRHDEGEITWDELQAIKNHVLGPGALAVEIYPAEVDLVNVANLVRPVRREGGGGGAGLESESI